MARRPDEHLRTTFAQAVRDDATRQGLSPERATALAGCLDRAFPAAVNKSITAGEPSFLDLVSAFWQAAAALDPERLFSVFESTPADRLPHLIDRVAAATYLADPETPLFDLDELAQSASQVLAFVRDHDEELRSRGEVVAIPPEFRWLGLRLASLHHHHRGLRFAEIEDGEPGRAWEIYDVGEPTALEPGLRGPVGFDALRRQTPGSRLTTAWQGLRAPTPWDHLTRPGGLARLRSPERNAALQLLRRNTLGLLIDCVSIRAPGRIWPAFVDELGKHFDAPEVAAMLGESVVWGAVEPTGQGVDITECILELGPLIGLLEVVGHFEKELTIGPLATARIKLAPILGTPPTSDLGRRFPPYFQCLDTDRIGLLDEALDLYLALEREERDFWPGFQARLRLDLKTDFPIRIEVPSIRVRARHANDARQMLQGLSAEIERRFEEHDRAQDDPIRSPLAIGQNRFVLDGSDWLIEFEGAVARIKASKNMARIARLLERPGVDLHALYLARIEKGGAVSVADDMTAQGTIAAQIEAGALSESGQGLERFTTAELASLGAARVDLECQIEEARRNGDRGRIELLQEQRDEVDRYVLAGLGLRGRIRSEGGWIEDARNTAGNSITRGIETIRDKLEGLSRQLHRSIDKGVTCVYRPDPPCTWRVLFEPPKGAPKKLND